MVDQEANESSEQSLMFDESDITLSDFIILVAVHDVTFITHHHLKDAIFDPVVELFPKF